MANNLSNTDALARDCWKGFGFADDEEGERLGPWSKTFTSILTPPLSQDDVSCSHDVDCARRFGSSTPVVSSTRSQGGQPSHQVLGQSCSKALDSGAFADFPISTDLDSNGAGNITLNGQSYMVHEHADFSGGITCTRMYSDVDSFVRCSIKVPNSLQAKPLSAENSKACFTRGTLDMETTSNVFAARLAGSKEYDLSETSLSMSEHPPKANVRGTSGANGPPDCSWHSDVVLIGNGDPHQNYLHTQLSIPIRCGGADSCNVGESNAISYSVNYSFGGNFFGWASGGFSVTKTVMTGNQHGCVGHKGQTVCIWKNTAHTAYSVRERQRSRCDPTQFGDRYVLVSPNDHTVGSYYYCVVGSCQNQGNSWMDRNGRAGGP
ncbi:hypothetical protein V501_07314 [Pseudogymnoascus sp. VKM F-4519 (FW-2642)]|nr:hypothetical protein V501_07314 [Pseudogymnoascus sp. VKM F-4519 (FW-2642)]